MSRNGIQWIEPDWPAPANVRAISTLRTGGVSQPPFDSLNLALHVGDNPKAVQENRRRVMETIQLAMQPCWLQQVHGVNVVRAEHYAQPPEADACIANESGKACVVM